MSVHSDTGPFAIVPEWLLDVASANAVKLYAILARYADKQGHGHPGRKTLAERMQLSVKSVDRVLEELVSLGALEVQPRFDEKGDRDTNDYLVLRMRRGSDTHGATGGDTHVAQTRARLNENDLTVTEPPQTDAQSLTAFYVDECKDAGYRPTSEWIGMLASRAKRCAGFPEPVLRGAIYAIAHEHRSPATLSHVIADYQIDEQVMA